MSARCKGQERSSGQVRETKEDKRWLVPAALVEPDTDIRGHLSTFPLDSPFGIQFEVKVL